MGGAEQTASRIDRKKKKSSGQHQLGLQSCVCMVVVRGGGGGGRQNEKKKKKKNRETEEGKLAAQMDCVHIISDQTRE